MRMKYSKRLHELFAGAVIWVIVLGLLAPLVAEPLANPAAVLAAGSPPAKPENLSPYDGAAGISLTPLLTASAFTNTSPDPVTHVSSRWQVTSTSGDYSGPVYDSGTDTTNLTQIRVPLRMLHANTTYYWHVRYDADTGYSSAWSDETSFTTLVSALPITPTNGLPMPGSLDNILTPTLESSPFASPDGEATHFASQWQITTTSGSYTSPVFDSGTATTNLTSISIGAGYLVYGTTYYWHVRYCDAYGNWSAYSTQTSFATEASRPPYAPVNTVPVSAATSVSLTPTLQASPFSDPNSGDSHTASQWWIASNAGFTTMVFDSGIDMINKTTITIPAEFLKTSTTYFWKVRYRDSYYNWSDWSSFTSFTTTAMQSPNKPSNTSPAAGATGQSLTPTLTGSAFSDPDAVDSPSVSQWQITTTPGIYTIPVFDSGTDTSHLTSLTVTGGYLRYDATYYWHVRYRDSYGNWSAYSNETSFATAASGAPNTPSNVRPEDGTTNITLTPTLQATSFSDPDVSDYQFASQWQIATNSTFNTAYVVFDSGIDRTNLTFVSVPQPLLERDVRCYWHVRYQDSYGNWSGWSSYTNFTTFPNNAPVAPSNVRPTDGSTDVVLTVTLEGSPFFDPDEGDSHRASQWQIATNSTFGSDYLVYDSSFETGVLTNVTVPSGILRTGTLYFWRVRYADSQFDWSAWSSYTDFTTMTNQPPSQPWNVQPADGSTDVPTVVTLEGGLFSDAEGEAHRASQWQVATDSAFSDGSIAYESGSNTLDLTTIDVTLHSGTLYFWRVRYQDTSYDWSLWSNYTNFTTAPPHAPGKPVNTVPVAGATSVSLTPTLQSSPFSDPDTGDSHTASQWQIASDAGFTNMVFDSGIDIANKTSITIPSGYLTISTAYFWKVRYRDSYNNWSPWSSFTNFTTTPMQVPNKPGNTSPAAGTTGQSLTPTLTASAFSDPDAVDSHSASQWQITTTPGNYTSPVFDSGMDTTNLTGINIGAGYLTYGTTYFWHVRYRDSYGNWSAYSNETSFATAASGAPNTPSNVRPEDGTTNITLTPTLQATSFSDPDEGDSHFASQWQIATNSTFDTAYVVFDSGIDRTDPPAVSVPSHLLQRGTLYYWHVRYEDSYGNWSDWSSFTNFTTFPNNPPVVPSNIRPTDGTTDVVLTVTLEASPFVDPDEGDSHHASQWQIATDVSFSSASLVYDSSIETSDLTTITVPSGILQRGTLHFWRVRYADSQYDWSPWSNCTNFTTAPNHIPVQPWNAWPSSGTNDAPLAITMQCGPFSDADGDTHQATQWQVATNNTFTDTSIAYDSGIDTTHLTSTVVTLDSGTPYFWRVRHQDSHYDWSLWSDYTNFTTTPLQAPDRPSNTLPNDGTTAGINPTLQSSDFHDRDPGDSHTYSQWQIRTASGDYTSPVFDTGTSSPSTSINVPAGYLSYATTYFWHVRYEDSYGNWSAYSNETSFTTIPSGQPESTPFSDPDEGDSQRAAQWQVATNNTFTDTSIAYDSGIDTTHLTSISLPPATLHNGTLYFWHVRYQDSYGNWSGWSVYSNFTTRALQAPDTPSNTAPADGTADVSLTPTLRASTFSDPDVGDSHATSWWQVTAIPGDYSRLVFNSGITASDLTQVAIPAGTLETNTTYYWHVRYQDSYGNWSAFSEETSFTTITTRPPFISEVAVSAITHNSAIVTWTTDQPATSQVEYGADASYGLTTAIDMNLVTNHSVKITGLNPSSVDYSTDPPTYTYSTYHYRVRSKNATTDEAVGPDGSFRTGVPPDTTPPVISEVSVSGITDTTVLITWTTSEPATSQVECGTDTGYGTTTAVDTHLVTNHELALSGLTNGTTYHYVVRSRDAAGNEGMSADSTFTTSPPPDITPPAISAAAVPPQEITSFSVRVVWTTDEDSTSQVEYGLSDAYGSITVLHAAMLRSHSVTLTGLMPNTTYHYRVRSRDAAWNEGASPDATFTTGATVPPTTPSNVAPANGVADTTLTPELKASTFLDADTADSHAASWWQITTIPGNYTNPVFDSGLDTLHLAEIQIAEGVLRTNTTYYWHVRYQDSYGRWSPYSGETSFTTVADTTAPVISGAAVSGLSSTSAVIAWNTDEPSTTQVEYGTTTAYGSVTTLDANLVNSHSVTLTALTPGTTYHYRLRSKDASSNEAVSLDGSFATATVPDTTPPLISGVTSSPPTSASVVITWITDEASTTQLDYGATGVYGLTTPLDTRFLTTHTVTLTGLTPSTPYYYQVKSRDASGNEATSPGHSFTTSGPVAPVTPTNIAPFDAAVDISLTPTLKASAFSDADTGDTHTASWWQISTKAGDYSSLFEAFDSSINAANKTQIAVPAGALQISTSYYWHVRYQDTYGNWSTWSAESSFRTLADTTGPVLSAVASYLIGSTEARITWTTDETATSQVDYGPTDAYGSTTPLDPRLVSNHIVNLANLSSSSVYHYRVRSKDASGNESISADATFSTILSVAPNQPSNIAPADGALDIGLTPTLKSSVFSDADPGDSHAASWWQLSLTAGDYGMPAYNTGIDSVHKTSLTIPAGILTYETVYHWRVRYQDSYGNWS
ncbi:MAG: fibronectin type III domain-containing protein, partial [Chloroflexi bacterium]|nr:fibronectin type III domain-containing protein [Chloroflexota bacterium]